MNKIVTTAAVATAALMGSSALAAVPGSWTGPYAGAQIGINQASSDHTSSENGLNLGVYGGYQMQFTRHFVFGGDAYYVWNQKKDHSVRGGGTANYGTNDYGVDFLAGFPVGDMGAWMPYAKVGYGWGHGTGALSGTEGAVRYGAGIAWKLTRRLSVNAQYMHQNFGSSNDNLQNDNWSVGATWHFSTTGY